MKRIVIVGGGIAGTFAAIRIKENHHDYLVSIFERNDKLLKKIYATGNGKCNFANQGEIDNKYHNQEFVEPILSSFTYKDIISYFYNIGVVSKEIAFRMANNAKHRLNVDVCVSFTGNAGPEAMEDKPVGLIYIGLSTPHFSKVSSFQLEGSRHSIQEKAVSLALTLIEEALKN